MPRAPRICGGIARLMCPAHDMALLSRRLSPALMLVLSLGAAPTFAQTGGTTATLRGSVYDESNGVLPGATITLTSVATRATRIAVADERGGFAFTSLFPGAYDLRVELAGFKTVDQQGIALSPNDTRGIDIRLEVGDRTEVVTVRAARGEVMQTETGAREGVLTAHQIDNLSIISRSSLELLRILPGVVAPEQNQLESVTFSGGANNTQGYTVNGIRSSNNTVSLDGSNLIDMAAHNGVTISLNNDMVEEVKVQSSNFAAEYGSGAIAVTAVTKSGTSKFRGSLYDYVRDWRVAANDRSNSITGIEKPRSDYFYPGGNIGGPVPLSLGGYNTQRDRLFFWAGLEVQRQKVDSGSHLSTTMSAAARTGDLAEFLANRGQNLNHPAAVVIPGGFPAAGTPAPNNNLTAYVTPLGRAMANLYPLPNYPDPDNRYNYVYSALEPTNRIEMKTRVDWNISANTKAYVRVARDSEEIVIPRGGASEFPLPTPLVSASRGGSYLANLVQVLSPTMTHEVLISSSRLTSDISYRDPSKLRMDTLNVTFQGVFPDQSPYLPYNSNSWTGGQLGDSGLWYNDLHARNNELMIGDRVTKTWGAHLVKVGASVARLGMQLNEENEENGVFVYEPGVPPGSTGSQIGDLLVGRPSVFMQGTRIKDLSFRMWNLEGFAQDSWKVRSNITLEYGVRIGYWTNNAEVNGLGAWFDPRTYDATKGTFLDPPKDTRVNGVRYAGLGQAPPGLLENRKPFGLPRVNVAWDIGGNGVTVLRGGYGMFANRPIGHVDYADTFVPPTFYNVGVDAFSEPDLGGVGLTYDTIHLVPFATLLGSQRIETPTPRSFTFPKTDSYSVSFARRIFAKQVVEVAYVGTRGRNLVSWVDINAVPLGALSSGILGDADLSIPVNRVNLDAGLVNSRRPFPVHGKIAAREYEGRSRYNSLQLTMSRQTGKRLQYMAAYTLSRTTGTVGGEFALRDPFNPSRTYGVLDEDRTHIFTLSWNALLPDGARGSLDGVFGRVLLNGWQLSGISTVISGVPIRLSFGADAEGGGVSQAYFGTPDVVGAGGQGNGLAPEFTCDPRLGGSEVGEKILNIGCIKVPDFGTNPPLVPPYDLRTPVRMNHDLTVFKNFGLHGAQKLQFRVGFFDIFNTAYATVNGTDIDLFLETTCNRRVDHVPNGVGGYADGVCDPGGGYSFTDVTKDNFGKINLKRGHRVVEFVLKYYF